jgi:hypothetical protein
VLRWLTRLFGQRDEAETAPAAPPPLETPLAAAADPTPSEAVAVVEPIEAEPIEADSVEAEPVEADPIEALTLVEMPETTADADPKETCPTCGKTGVFAGPPGQRFCTYCALRDELFERSAAATE